MNKLLAGIVAVCLLQACGKREDLSGVVQLGGEVLNARDSMLVLERMATPYSFFVSPDVWRDTIVLDDSLQTFYTRLSIPQGMYRLTYRDHSIPLYLLPGKTLNINFEHGKAEETTAFSGSLKKVNRYLYADHVARLRLQRKKTRTMSLEEADFDHSVDSARKSLDTLLVRFITDKPTFDPEFLHRRQLANYYWAVRWRLEYPRLRDYYNDTLAPLSESYMNELDQVPLNDPAGVDLVDYMTVLTLRSEAYVNERAVLLEAGDPSFADITQWRLQWVDSALSEPALRNYMRATTLRNYIAFELPEPTDSLLTAAVGVMQDSALKEALEQEIADRLHLAAGNEAPMPQISDEQGNPIAPESWKGKAVYIDVWATWCGPCLDEAPDFEALARAYRNQPIQFISISIDENRQHWLTFLEENEPSNPSYHALGGWQSDWAQAYRIQAIPRYIAIDAQGRLVRASAPRPSDLNIRSFIDGLLLPAGS